MSEEYEEAERKHSDKIKKYLQALRAPARTFHNMTQGHFSVPAPNAQNIPRQEEPVPQVDNGESLNITGDITAISVNGFENHKPCKPDANGNPIVKVTQGYRLTVTIDTFDVETVKQLMLIRTKQHSYLGKVTADLIVWPLQQR